MLADHLRDWLPMVMQSIKPWMSDQDIDAGSRWLTEVSTTLNNTQIGIIVITPENQHNPWLLFEAGALSKTLEQTCVCPLLFDMTQAQLSGPLTQFQSNILDQAGMNRILSTVNKYLGDKKIDQKQLETIIQVWWPMLEKNISQIPESDTPIPQRNQGDQLEELLNLARENLRRENLRLESSRARDEKLDSLLSFIDKTDSTMSALMRHSNKLQQAATRPIDKPSESDAASRGTTDIPSFSQQQVQIDLPAFTNDMAKMAEMMRTMHENDKKLTDQMLSFNPENPKSQ